MLTVTIASGKGGTLKTSLTAALAVCAISESKKVAIIDLNADQASLTGWWQLRGEPAAPYLVELSKLHVDIKALDVTGWKYCLIDTPPDEMAIIEAAIAESDVVLIPVRASALDIEASKAVVDICKRRRKPYGYVLVAVDTRPQFKDMTKEALADLAEITKGDKLGKVLTAQVPYHKAFITAMADGKTGQETDTTLQRKVADVWEQLKAVGGKRRG